MPDIWNDKYGYPEDAHRENGNYLVRCVECSAIFNGHKDRVLCKVCSVKEEGTKT